MNTGRFVRLLLPFLATFAICQTVAAAKPPAVSAAPAIPFEENQGQFDEQVAFAARTFGGTVFVTHDGRIVYSLPGGGSVGAHGRAPLPLPLPPVAPTFGLALHETLVGGHLAQRARCRSGHHKSQRCPMEMPC